jgi:hypothetical protein
MRTQRNTVKILQSYGCLVINMWVQRQKITAEIKFVRHVSGHRLLSMYTIIQYNTIYSELEMFNLEKIQELKDKWEAHLLQLNTSRIPQRILTYKLPSSV